MVLPRGGPLPVLAYQKRGGVRSGRPRLVRCQFRDVLGELGEDRTSEVHPTRICKGFERAGSVEMAFDFQRGRAVAGRLDTPEAFAREAPRPSIPRPWIVQRRTEWS